MRIAQYTSRVGARTEVARLVKSKYLAEAKKVGIKEADLDVVIAEGDKAKEADREQHAQIAKNAVARGHRSTAASDLLGDEGENKLRDRILLVIDDLTATDEALADWLTRLSFARYRFREHEAVVAAPVDPTKPAPAAPTADELKKVERVERQDIATRLDGLAALCAAIVRPGNEAIAKAFEERELPAAEIKAIGERADELAKHGKNAPLAAEAGAREAAAVEKQKKKWAGLRRPIGKLAAGHPEVAALVGEC